MRDKTGWRVERLGEVGSTNDEARTRAIAGDPGRLWIVAERQSAGRGRNGRIWTSPAGNLYASALLVEPCAVADAPQLGFVAGVALIDALKSLAGHSKSAALFALKWPNDVLADGAKLAGILVEGMTRRDGVFASVVGLGVNCESAPGDLPYPATHLRAALGRPVEAEELFETLKELFDERLAQWSKGKRFDLIREAWLASAAGIGRQVRIARGARPVDGQFEGLDPSGRLQLRRADGALEFVEAGDFSLVSG